MADNRLFPNYTASDVVKPRASEAFFNQPKEFVATTFGDYEWGLCRVDSKLISGDSNSFECKLAHSDRWRSLNATASEYNTRWIDAIATETESVYNSAGEILNPSFQNHMGPTRYMFPYVEITGGKIWFVDFYLTVNAPGTVLHYFDGFRFQPCELSVDAKAKKRICKKKFKENT